VDEAAATVDEGRAQERLDRASVATREAYQHSARLIRLLSILGRPISPEELVDEALSALSSAFRADVICLAYAPAGRRVVVMASCGLPEGDPAFDKGWAVNQVVSGVLRDGSAATWVCTAEPDEGWTGPSITVFGLHSAAWLPIDHGGSAGRLLALFRRPEEPFSRFEMELLASVAARLRLSVEARQRAVAADRLARWGHRLTNRTDLDPLFADAAAFVRDLLGSDRSCVIGRDTTGGPGVLVQSPGGWLTADMAAAAGEVLAPAREPPGEGPRFVPAGQWGPDPEAQVLLIPVDGAEIVLCAGWDGAPPFEAPTLEAAAIFAHHLAAAMSNVRLHRALSRSEASLRMITDSVNDLIAVTDVRGVIAFASAAYGREIGRPAEWLVGRSVLDFADSEDHPRVRQALADAAAQSAEPAQSGGAPSGAVTVEYRICTGDGAWVWVESVLRPALAGAHLVMSSRIIDDRVRREEDLLRRAAHDPLTGLPNRAALLQALHDALRPGAEGDVGVLFCDLDRFKDINDRYGHGAGDGLLQQVAGRLQECSRAHDLVARLGGDEFVVVLDGVTTSDEVSDVARRIVRAIGEPFQLGTDRVRISVSVGGAIGSRDGATGAWMLQSADAQMYDAKRDRAERDRAERDRAEPSDGSGARPARQPGGR
jgi:diguanylate cyclase (GGDEF)-like protein/PAS domain S-box-containing protein